MKHLTNSLTAADGLTIHCQSWIPDAPVAVVVISHGYAEHSGRYERVAVALVEENYAVYAFDHRHHGKSDGERGYVQSVSALVDDLHQYIQHVKLAQPGLPTILLGHSMGGLVAVLYAVAHSYEIDLLVLSAPYLIDGGNAPPILVKFARIIAGLFPRLPIKPIDSTAVSRDPQVVKDYDTDPLNSHNKVRAATGYELLSSAARALERADEIRLPILIMHGDADRLAAVDGSRQLNDTVQSQDKSLRIYNGLYHEILNEPEKDQVLADMIDWIRKRV